MEDFMLKKLLATTALSVLLAGGAVYAQDADTMEPEAGTAPEAPMAADDAAEPMADEVAPVAGTETPPADPVGEIAMSPIDIGALTAEELIGTAVQNPDGENLGTIEDAMLDGDGKISGLVVSFGGFLGFGESTVEVGLDEVEFMSDGADNIIVTTNLQPEDLEDRPEVEL
jgi:sporulation protein YlmC with PRC-barrel domain